MRRKDKEITDKKTMEQILKRQRICVVSMSAEDGGTYSLPINYGYDADTFYFHSSKAGRKIELLKKNQNVRIVVVEDKEMVKADIACKFSYKYASVICSGKAEFVETFPEKDAALKIFMEMIAGMKDAVFSPKALEGITVIKVKVTKMTGKANG